MEFIVAKVQRRVDGLEGLEIDIDLSFLAFRGDNFTAIYDKAIGRHFRVKLQALLGRGNGRKDRQAVDTGLDVRGGTLRLLGYRYMACG